VEALAQCVFSHLQETTCPNLNADLSLTVMKMGEMSPSGWAIYLTLDATPSVDILAKCVLFHLRKTACPILDADPSVGGLIMGELSPSGETI
jgi:hypothetical protein